MAVNTLLKSCAMPPASLPHSIFWLCAYFSSSAFCSVGIDDIEDRRIARVSPPAD